MKRGVERQIDVKDGENEKEQACSGGFWKRQRLAIIAAFATHVTVVTWDKIQSGVEWLWQHIHIEWR